MKRAAVSIPANIAEGRGKASDKDQVRFLRISTGSSYELDERILVLEHHVVRLYVAVNDSVLVGV